MLLPGWHGRTLVCLGSLTDVQAAWLTIMRLGSPTMMKLVERPFLYTQSDACWSGIPCYCSSGSKGHSWSKSSVNFAQTVICC